MKIPWLLLSACGVPLFMMYTKALRIDARELHEVQMRIKYHSEYWKKGNAFSAQLRDRVTADLLASQHPLLGKDVDADVTPQEWDAAGKSAAARDGTAPRHKIFGLF